MNANKRITCPTWCASEILPTVAGDQTIHEARYGRGATTEVLLMQYGDDEPCLFLPGSSHPLEPRDLPQLVHNLHLAAADLGMATEVLLGVGVER